LAEALPQTPLGELTVLPRHHSCIEGGLLLREGRTRGERRRKSRGKQRKEGRRKEKRGREERGRIATWLLEDGRHCLWQSLK